MTMIAVRSPTCRYCGQPIVYVERLRAEGGWVHTEGGDWARCDNFHSGPRPLSLPTIRPKPGHLPTSRPAPPAA